MVKTGIVIQAQLELDISLKNKDLFEIINEKTVIENTVQQALKCKVDKVIILASKGNKEVENLKVIKENNIPVYYNTNSTFLYHFKEIAEKEKLDIIVRIIGNNPLILPNIIEYSIDQHIKDNIQYSYFKGYPIGIVPSEIISVELLKEKKEYERNYARYISFELLNAKDIKSKAVQVDNKYSEYSKVDFSYTSAKKNKIEKIIKNGVTFKDITEEFEPIPNKIKHIEITNVCNIKCIMCSRSGELADKKSIEICKGFMNFDNFKKIIDKFDMIDELTLLGGEPLLNKDVKNMILYCKKRCIKVNIITNGLLLNDELSSFLINNIHSIRFSIDGYNKEVYEIVRKHADFDTLIKNIKNFMKIYQSNKEPFIEKIGINYVYMKQNYEFMDKMIDLCDELNIKEISFSPYCNPSYITDKKLIDEFNIVDFDRLNTIMETTREKAYKSKINAKIDEYKNSWLTEWNQCEYIDSFYITWDGYITPCCLIDNKDVYNFGNIITNDIAELYNNKKWAQFRRSLISNEGNEICKKKCGYYFGNAIGIKLSKE